MRRRSLVLLGAAVFLLSACEVRSEIVVTINENGSGTFELLIADDQGGTFRLAGRGTDAFAPPAPEGGEAPPPPTRPDALIFDADAFLAFLDDYLAEFFADIEAVVIAESELLDPEITGVFEEFDDWESVYEWEEWDEFLAEDLDYLLDYEELDLGELDLEDGFEDDFLAWEDEFTDWDDEYGDLYYGDEYDDYYYYYDEEEPLDEEEPTDGGEGDYYEEEDPYYEEPPPDGGGGGDTGDEWDYRVAPKEGITAALANTPFEALADYLPAGWAARPYNEDGFTGGVLSYDFKDIRQLDRAIKQLNAAVADDTWPFDGFTLRREGDEYLFEVKPKDRTPSGGEEARGAFDALKNRVETRVTLRTPAKTEPSIRRAEGRLQESFLRAERGAFDSVTVLMPMEGGKPISATSDVPEGAPAPDDDGDGGGSTALGMLLIGAALALGGGALIFGLMRRQAALATSGGPVDPGTPGGWTAPPPAPPSAPPPEPPPPQPPPQPPPNPPPP